MTGLRTRSSLWTRALRTLVVGSQVIIMKCGDIVMTTTITVTIDIMATGNTPMIITTIITITLDMFITPALTLSTPTRRQGGRRDILAELD